MRGRCFIAYHSLFTGMGGGWRGFSKPFYRGGWWVERLLIAFLLGWVVGGEASHSLFTGVGGEWRGFP